MRFDGYYLLSDFLDLPNLHTRAFALARWQLREWLFALGEAPPELFRRTLRQALVGLAMFIWIYRLVVFTGIAVFVYHYFFKALGIVCFAIEIGWFVALPLLAEAMAWVKKREQIRRSARVRWLVPLLGALVLLLCVPFPQRIRLVGELTARNEFKIVPPEPAFLVSVAARDGSRVAKDAVVVTLSSEILQHRLAQAKAREASARAQLVSAESDPAMRARLPTMQAALALTQAAMREAEAALQNLEVKAPFAGVFRISDCDLRPGESLERQEEVATITGDGPWQVIGYLDEHDRHLAAAGATAEFYPDGVPGTALGLHVVAVDRDAARSVAYGMLTTPFGGPLPAKVMENSLVPDQGVYRVVLETDRLPPEFTTAVRRGRVVIRGQAESLAMRLGRAIGAVLWREAGF
jgi:putative peptide zinc metalloprotease protein